MPRWLKLTLLIVAIIALLMAAVMAIDGKHGPARHLSPADHPEGGHR